MLVISSDAGIVRRTENKNVIRLRKSGNRLTDRARRTFRQIEKGKAVMETEPSKSDVRVWLRTSQSTINVTVMTQAHQQAASTIGDLGRPTLISLPVETDAHAGSMLRATVPGSDNGSDVLPLNQRHSLP